jgi:pimeloyl-ACP methyl ester carboxylesterase
MKTMRPWLSLLSILLFMCAGNSVGSNVASTKVSTDGNSGDSDLEQQRSWLNPEQERWVKEPVFQGSLHLVEGGQENLQTIVLIHGLGHRGMLDWQRVFPELTDKYHVIAIDLPGFGGSDNHQVQYAPEKYSRLVNWVVTQFAHETVIVIGHSMGGAVSLRYAHNYPKHISRLVLVDAAGILQRTVFIKHVAKVPVTYEWLERYQQTIPMLDKLIRKMASKADGWTQSLLITMDRMPDIPQLMMSSGLAQQYLYKDRSTMNAALGLVYEDFSAAVREVDVPTHIIWGEHDNVAPIRTGKVLAGLLSNAELHMIREAGHVPMTDSFDDFMAVLMHSLENEPIAKQAQRRLAVISEEPVIEEDIRCNDRNNLEYTGHHEVILINNCRGVVLRDLVAESIELVSSEVTLENVELNSVNIGLTVVDSVVVSTLLQVDSKIGMTVESSYLDIAGADFVTSDKFVDIKKNSQLYFSLSQSRHDEQVMPLHGVSIGTVLQVH